tara:strand:+ start:72 stop:359 length:288 start_codon:yes stop_codon:yes gene_type:complete
LPTAYLPFLSTNPEEETTMKRAIKPCLAALAGLVMLFGLTNIVAAKPMKVDVCHVTGSGVHITINISEKAVPAHLDHGDSLGECGGLPPAPPSEF